jgi:hypothetical protein
MKYISCFSLSTLETSEAYNPTSKLYFRRNNLTVKRIVEEVM